MRLSRRLPRSRLGFNIAPMIDVVFLLIIFFMTVSHLSRLEVEKIELPRATQGEISGAAAMQKLIINILPDGQIMVGGSPQTLASLQQILAEQVERLGVDKVSLLIRGDQQTPWQAVEKVLALCGQANIYQIKIAVLEQD